MIDSSLVASHNSNPRRYFALSFSQGLCSSAAPAFHHPTSPSSQLPFIGSWSLFVDCRAPHQSSFLHRNHRHFLVSQLLACLLSENPPIPSIDTSTLSCNFNDYIVRDAFRFPRGHPVFVHYTHILDPRAAKLLRTLFHFHPHSPLPAQRPRALLQPT